MKPLILKMKAFGSYGKETTIDFTKPTQNLFLITGDTGAGKTTIFDAIVFALYGQASSSYNKKEGVLLQSHFVAFEEKPSVEFTFAESATEQAPVYKIVRVPKHLRPMKRRGKTGKEFAEEKGSVELFLPDGSAYPEKNIDEKIEGIIGLTREQFMQVAMIAQGEFMELLRAKTDDKKEIFRKLFNTEIYEKIRRILEGRKKQKEKEIAIIRTQCQTEMTHVTVSETFEKYEEITKYSKELQNGNISCLADYLSCLEEFCKDAKVQIEGITAEWECASKVLDSAKNEYTKAEALTDAFAKYEEAKNQLEECQKICPQMEEKKQLTDRLIEAYKIKPIYQLCQDAERAYADIEQKLTTQRTNLPELEEKTSAAFQDFQEISVRYESEKRKLHELLQKVADAIKLFERKELAEQERDTKKIEAETLEKKKDKQEQEIKELKDKQTKSLEQIEALSDAYANKAKAEAEQKQAEFFEERIAKLNELGKSIAAKTQMFSKKQEEFVKASEEYQKKSDYYEHINNLFLSEQAGILARALVAGEPCKVCGSREHPAPYQFSEAQVVPSQQQVEKAKKESSLCNEKQQKKALEAGELKSALQKEQEQYQAESKELCDQFALQDPGKLAEAFQTYKSQVQQRADDCEKNVLRLEEEKKQSAKLAETIEGQEKNLDHLNRMLSDCKEKLAGMDAALKELANTTGFATRTEAHGFRTEAQAQFEALEEVFVQKEKTYKLTAKQKEKADSLIEEYQRMLPQKAEHAAKRRQQYEALMQQLDDEQLLQWQELTEQYTPETLQKWQKELQQYQETLQKAQVKKETAKSMIKDSAKPDMENLAQNIKQCQEQFEALAQKRMELAQIAKTDEMVLQRLKNQLMQREEIIHAHTKLDNLYRMISGTVNKQNKMDLETFVQRYYLKNILIAANRRFEKMTAGQFQLFLKDMDDAGRSKNEGLDLMVYSLVTGKKREVRTLSGGESFMAALSLALGMADQIKEGSGAIHLDMMFIDEGFGSLDEHSRGQAVRILKEMAGGNRMIGIISHVTELKQEIENQLVVSKNEKGSRADWKIC